MLTLTQSLTLTLTVAVADLWSVDSLEGRPWEWLPGTVVHKELSGVQTPRPAPVIMQ